MSLKIENARGQCYDGAATMSGTKRGVANHIKSLNKFYTDCYEHALNLAVNDWSWSTKRYISDDKRSV